MNARFFDKFVSIVNTHGDYDLFAWRSLCSYVDVRLWFVFTANDFLNEFNFFVLKTRKSFFNLQRFFSCVRTVRWYLSIRFFLYRRGIFLKILRNFIYLLRWFSWDRRWKSRNIRGFYHVFFFVDICFFDSLWTKFWFDFVS